MNLYRCVELPRFRATGLAAIRKAFSNATRIPLRQHWRETEEEGFAPADVLIGWRERSLHVLAELSDKDIFTRAKKPNQRMWELGDVFEIFLCPAEQAAYYEFHVTPNNQWLQLRFGSSRAIAKVRKTNDITPCLIPEKVFQSTVWLRLREKKWFVHAEIPANVICEEGVSPKRGTWRFSFSRYDYTRGRKQPVISSTSAHREENFHARDEWSGMEFCKR